MGPAFITFVPRPSCADTKDGSTGGEGADQPCCQAASRYRVVWTEPLRGFQQGQINVHDLFSLSLRPLAVAHIGVLVTEGIDIRHYTNVLYYTYQYDVGFYIGLVPV